MVETQRLAGEALAALEKAVGKNTVASRGAVQKAVNRIAKRHGGRLPNGGTPLDYGCRRELRNGVAGEKAAALAEYLRDLSGAVRREPPPVKAVKPDPPKAAESK